MMTPSQKRKKGKELVNWVADKLKAIFVVDDKDIIVPEPHEHGEDLRFSANFAQILPVSYECKNQRGYAHLYTDMAQCVKNSNGKTPTLVVKAPYKDPLVILAWDDYEALIKKT